MRPEESKMHTKKEFVLVDVKQTKNLEEKDDMYLRNNF